MHSKIRNISCKIKINKIYIFYLALKLAKNTSFDEFSVGIIMWRSLQYFLKNEMMDGAGDARRGLALDGHIIFSA